MYTTTRDFPNGDFWLEIRFFQSSFFRLSMDDIAFSELQRHGRVADLKVSNHEVICDIQVMFGFESLIFNIFGVIQMKFPLSGWPTTIVLVQHFQCEVL